MKSLFYFRLKYAWLNISLVSNDKHAVDLICEQFGSSFCLEFDTNDSDLTIYSFVADDVSKYSGKIIYPQNSFETIQKLLLTEKTYYHYYESGMYSYRYLLRIVTGLLRNEAMIHGMQVVHGSSIELMGYGIIFFGGKGVGKTTLAAILTKYGNAKFVSNDKTLVSSNNDILCIPDLISISQDSIDKVCLRAPANPNSYLDIQNGIYSKYKITYREMKEIFNFDTQYQAKLFCAFSPHLVKGNCVSITPGADINDCVLSRVSDNRINTICFDIDIGVDCHNEAIVYHITDFLNNIV